MDSPPPLPPPELGRGRTPKWPGSRCLARPRAGAAHGRPGAPLDPAGRRARATPRFWAPPSRVRRATGVGGRGRPGVARERVPSAGPGFGPRPPGLVGRARGKDALGSRSEPRAFRGGGRRPSRVAPLVPSCASGRSLSRRLPGGPPAFPATHRPFPAGLGRNPREKGLGAPT